MMRRDSKVQQYCDPVGLLFDRFRNRLDRKGDRIDNLLGYRGGLDSRINLSGQRINDRMDRPGQRSGSFG